MATRQDERMIEPDMNPKDLWLEEIFTDRRVGTIRRMTPVDGNGVRDPGREVLYVGETQVMSQMGALPINFALEAKTLEEAATMFGASRQGRDRAHGAGAAGTAPPAGLVHRRPAGRPAADAAGGRRQNPDAVENRGQSPISVRRFEIGL